MPALEFDHVMLAARDIDAAAGRLWEEHGLASAAGGRHPGHGTGNRIVPLGTSYIEIIGIVDGQEAAESALGAWVKRYTADGDRLIAVCLRADDLAGLAARLGLEPIRMSRTRPDGEVLSWSLVGLDEMLTDPGRPFFIRWEMPDELYPGREPASHRFEPKGLAWAEIGADDTDLRDWTGGTSIDLRVVDGQGVSAVGIQTDDGLLELRN